MRREERRNVVRGLRHRIGDIVDPPVPETPYHGSVELLAVGVPVAKVQSLGWDWWPIPGIVIAVILARRTFGLRLAPPVLVTAVLGGLAYASAVHAWGVLPPLGAAAATAVVAPLVRHRASQDPGPPV